MVYMFQIGSLMYQLLPLHCLLLVVVIFTRTRMLENPTALSLLFLLPPEICRKLLGQHPHCPTFISLLSETARWNPQNLLSKKSRRKPYIAVETVGRRKP
ncbi:hypothetical protein GLYMA_14G163533v4 [Glycine max]|nr:hypothetical protein GLYMA_14G163533v4 [Glycine max]